MDKLWKIGIYCRLSKEDGDKDESNSIGSQRKFINSYISNNIENYEVVDEFIDDGYTGTNFDRPNFKRMISLVEDEKINCVIVKDSSRFGRDYIGVGRYLEKFFPLNDIRFIAINDGYDSLNESNNDDLIMPIKNIFNAQYSKDISKKVKSSYRSLQSEGKFTGAYTSYGYKKDENDKHKLVVDEVAAVVVKRIFDMYNSGKGKQTIAKILNAENIPCPSEYKKLNGLKYNNGHRLKYTKYWTYSTVNNILKNEMYIGNMVLNKSVRKTVRGKASKNSEENWIKVENTHDSIISKEEWNITQSLLKKNTRQLSLEENVGLFSGYIVCGNCGRAMSKSLIRCKDYKYYIYVCGTYKRYSVSMCKRNAIKLEVLEELVLDKLNEQINKAGKIKYDKKKNNSKRIDIKKYELQLDKSNRLLKSLYEDYKDGILTKEQYFEYKEDYTKKIEFAKAQIELVQKREEEFNSEQNRWIETLLKHKKIKHLDRETVAEVLDKIIITDINGELNVEIIFKFSLL